MNRFVAVVEVEETPTDVVLDEIGPLMYNIPLLVSVIAATAGVPADRLPLIRVVWTFVEVKNGPTILPVMLIVEVAPGVFTICVTPVVNVDPVILIFTMFPLHAKTFAPEDVILLSILYVLGPAAILNTLFLLSGEVAGMLPVKFSV